MLLLGDCVEVLKTLPDNSVDSVVTDPPYELGFMGKSWDNKGIAYSVDMWLEVLRVLKPGGHLLAFGGTRTYHRMACAIEDAGFEIRDQMQWIYGSGFPKSYNISKGIDKINGESGRKYKFTKWMRSTGITAQQINDATETFMGSHYLTDKEQPAIPTSAIWAVLRPYCGDIPEWVDELVERIEAEREVVGKGVDYGHEADKPIDHEFGFKADYNITASSTPFAIQWDGWGSALKPANEPICVARKPLSEKSIVENVLKWGTGGINVDGCRIEGVPPSVPNPILNSPTGKIYGFKTGEGRNGDMSNATGRFPANIIFDEEAGRMLDEMSGELGISRGGNSNAGSGLFTFGQDNKRISKPCGMGDKGGASRFFYCAKASRSERNAGLEGMEELFSPKGNNIGRDMENPKNHLGGLQGSKMQNHHPTVKPISLMRYLCRLVTPPKGTVLDPFMGSGTTGCAASLEGFEFIGIEREAEYMEIAERRIAYYQKQLRLDLAKN